LQERTYLSAGMEFTMNILQPFTVHMGIYLGSADIGMAEQFLYHPEIGALTENMGGK